MVYKETHLSWGSLPKNVTKVMNDMKTIMETIHPKGPMLGNQGRRRTRPGETGEEEEAETEGGDGGISWERRDLSSAA